MAKKSSDSISEFPGKIRINRKLAITEVKPRPKIKESKNSMGRSFDLEEDNLGIAIKTRG
jgi:hypothetical protein